MRLLASLLLALSFTTAGHAQAPDFKLGVVTDMSGVYSAITGKGTVEAARLAVEDFGGSVLGRKIQVLSADHQNKPDVASTLARSFLDQEDVAALVDGTGSATSAAMLTVARTKGRMHLIPSAGSPIFSNDLCSDSAIHFTYDTNALAKAIVEPLIKQGRTSWFFITADYAGGHALQSSITPLVTQLGGTVVGSVLHPFPTSDFSSYIVRAQTSQAKVIVAANAGSDTVNLLKQASEFGVGRDASQAISTSLINITDIKSMGLPVAKGLYAGMPFYWDMDQPSRDFTKRFEARVGAVPEMTHAGAYSAVLHYLKAVQASGSIEAPVVSKKMKEMRVNDFWNKDVVVRRDGRVLHDMYLVQVKSPAESKGPSDVLNIVSKLPGEMAFPTIAEGKCAAAKAAQ